MSAWSSTRRGFCGACSSPSSSSYHFPVCCHACLRVRVPLSVAVMCVCMCVCVCRSVYRSIIPSIYLTHCARARVCVCVCVFREGLWQHLASGESFSPYTVYVQVHAKARPITLAFCSLPRRATTHMQLPVCSHAWASTRYACVCMCVCPMSGLRRAWPLCGRAPASTYAPFWRSLSLSFFLVLSLSL